MSTNIINVTGAQATLIVKAAKAITSAKTASGLKDMVRGQFPAGTYQAESRGRLYQVTVGKPGTGSTFNRDAVPADELKAYDEAIELAKVIEAKYSTKTERAANVTAKVV